MKGPHRLPDFSVVVWIKKNEKLRSCAIRSARCRRGGTLRNDRVSRHGRFPLGNQQCGRRAQTCRGIEGRLSATRSHSVADNKPRGRCGVDLHKGRTRYQALDAPSRPKIKSDCNGAGATSPSRMNRQVAESDEENDAEVFAQGCGECNTRCCVCCEAGDIGYPYTQFPCPLCK